MSTADDFFAGGSPSAKFDTIGTVVGGTITRIGDQVQQTEFKTGKPLFWDDGKPRMQLPITVQTELRDPTDPTDTGERTLWVKGRMKKAIAAALKAAGSKLNLGGLLTVTFVGEEDTGAGSPAKVYTATYAPQGGFFEPEQVATPAPAPQPAAPAPAPQPVQAAPPIVQPGMISPAQMTPEQQQLARSMGLIA